MDIRATIKSEQQHVAKTVNHQPSDEPLSYMLRSIFPPQHVHLVIQELHKYNITYDDIKSLNNEDIKEIINEMTDWKKQETERIRSKPDYNGNTMYNIEGLFDNYDDIHNISGDEQISSMSGYGAVQRNENRRIRRQLKKKYDKEMKQQLEEKTCALQKINNYKKTAIVLRRKALNLMKKKEKDKDADMNEVISMLTECLSYNVSINFTLYVLVDRCNVYEIIKDYKNAETDCVTFLTLLEALEYSVLKKLRFKGL
eukprot:174220_1